MSKVFNWIILFGLIALAVAMLGILGGRPAWPRTAEASAATGDATRCCQVVIDRLGIAQVIVADEMQSGNLKPIAALDECLRQQKQADVSACPEDFQIAELRFVAAEDSLLRHAQATSAENGAAAVRAAFELLTHQAGYECPKQLPADLKCDLDNLQSSRLALVQIALNYGVN